MNLPSTVLQAITTGAVTVGAPLSAPRPALTAPRAHAEPSPFLGPIGPWGGTSFDGAASSPMRSESLVALNSWWEITISQLRAMQIKSRGLRNNLHIYRNIVKTMVELSIGWGLVPLPKSGNKDYDRRAKAYWRRWGSKKHCDIRGMQDHCGLQTTACSDMIVDGETFHAKLTTPLTGFPVRKAFRSEQVGGLFGNVNIGLGWWNGIQYDADGKPLNYQFRRANGFNQNLFTNAGENFVASTIEHIFDQERGNQNRGIPWAYSALNTGMDAIDTEALAKVAQKLDAAFFGNLETPTGSAPASMEQLMSGTLPRESTQPDALRYLNVHGTLFPLFRTGEKINFNSQGRSLNVIEFLQYMFTGLAASFGMPVQIFWDMAKLGGANMRGVLEMGKRGFERVQRLMIDTMAQPDYEHVISLGILAYLYSQDFPGIEPLAPPPGMTGWDVCTWRGPRDITVDTGRDGKLYLELMRAGVMTREEWWSMRNEDPEEMERTVQEEVKMRRDHWVQELGLPEDKFWLKEFGATGTLTEDAAPPAPAPHPDTPLEDVMALLAELLQKNMLAR